MSKNRNLFFLFGLLHIITILSNHISLHSTVNPRSKYGHLSNHGSSRVSPADPSQNHAAQGSPAECLQGFCMGMYQECLNLLSNFINRCFKPAQNNPHVYYNNQSVANSMLLIDPPGFHYQAQTIAQSTPCMASYSDLLCNYLRYHLVFITCLKLI